MLFDEVFRQMKHHFCRKSIEEREQNSDTSSAGKERKELGEILARSVVDQKRLEDQMQAERARLADHLYANGMFKSISTVYTQFGLQ